MREIIKIFMVIDFFYPVVGGSEIQSLRLSNMLIQMGHKVSIITRRVKDLPFLTFEDQKRVYRLPTFSKGTPASLIFQIQNILLLSTHRSEYDIIHCHLATSTALSCILAGLITNRPVIVKLGGGGKTGDIQTSLKSLAGRIKLKLLKIARCHFIAPSKDIAKELTIAKFNSKRISIIPNGVDTNYFKPVSIEEKERRKEGLGLNGKKLALYIGRLETDKNLIALIDSWASLRDINQNWRLWIIGSGTCERGINSRIMENGLQKEVSLLRPVPSERVRYYLQMADLFIQPSRYEGISNSILEAMSCALPVLAARIAGNQELIRENFNGFLFNKDDNSDLRRVLRLAITDERNPSSLGSNGRDWIIEHFEISKVAERYLTLYNRLLLQHR